MTPAYVEHLALPLGRLDISQQISRLQTFA